MADRGQQKKEQPVNEADKRLAANWLKRIETAVGRFDKDFKRFARNRKLLRGVNPENEQERLLSNLHFANLAMMRPQVYAKDPEFAVKPSLGVPEARKQAMERFSATAEALLSECLVKRAKLKKRAKRMLTGAFATSVGWWKVCWQEDKRTDAIIVNQIKDTQDNLQRLEALRKDLDETSAQNHELKVAQLRETLAGLQAKAEVTVARGLTVDFVLSEDVIVLDDSVLELGDYERSDANAHRVWMTKDKLKQTFGRDFNGGKAYTAQSTGQPTAGSKDPKQDLYCTYEVWDQASNRVFHVCEGVEGFLREPFSPDWTGERWYPFFVVAFNEVEGQFYPLSDIELTEQLVAEYNDSRRDFVRDRKYALPLNIIRKGGSLTDEDVKRLANREGGDTILVEGVGGQPIGNDVWSGQLAQIRPENYNTQPARSDMEMLIGGGDAARGSVLQAKTATEAEILSQGLRGRSAERQDALEDVLSDVGSFSLQILLRKLTPKEVEEIAGPEAAAAWPTMTQPEEYFKLLTVDVRGGSTGKPDRLQEQDRWTKLLPVIEKAMAQIAQLRAQPGGEQQAKAIAALVKETLRRFDERVDISQFLPEDEEGEQPEQTDPMQDPRVQALVQQGQEMLGEMQQQVQDLQKQLADKEADRQAMLQKAEIDASRDVEVAKVKAPIEAQAKVEVARVNAGAQAMAAAAARPPEPEEPEEPPEEEGPSATEQLLAHLVQGQADLQTLLARLAQRPAMRLAHERDPVSGRISASVLAPIESEGQS